MNKEGTLIKVRDPKIYFDNVDINSSNQIESKQKEIEKEIIKLKGKILSLALATPKDITPSDNDPIDYISDNLNEILDNLCENIYDSYTVNTIEGILDAWRYSYNDEKDIYENCKTDEEVNKEAFPEDKHVEIKRDLNKFTFAPDDKNIDDAINRSIQNINFNKQLEFKYSDMVCILHGNYLFVDYDGQFIFKNVDSAIKVLDKKLDLHTSEYVSKDFIQNHPDFFPSIIEKMKKNYYELSEEELNKYISKFEKAYDDFVNDDYKITNMETIDTLYSGILSVLRNEIYEKENIKIIRFYDLISGYRDSEKYKDEIDKIKYKNIRAALGVFEPIDRTVKVIEDTGLAPIDHNRGCY